MKAFIVLTFGFLFWGFYEMSGGSEFEPVAESPFVEGALEGSQLASADEVLKDKPEIAARADADTSSVVLAAAASDTEAVGSAPALLVAANPVDEAEEIVAQVRAIAEPAVTPAATPETAPVQVAALDDPTLPALVEARISRVTFGEGSEAAAADENLDIRRVTGNRVNMRNGPGTNYGVVGRLVRNDEVEVLRVENGWAKLRSPVGDVGWMSAKFLRKVDS